MALTGKAKIAGVMGWPVDYSLSPRLHGFWLERYGIDGAYIPFAVHPDDVEAALTALPKLGLTGTNVTVPHKEAALRVCHEVDAIAQRIGAVNTIVVGPDGRLLGSNTDAFGFMKSLRQSAADWRADGGPAVVVGAGGAARAVVTALNDAGAAEIRLINRTQERAEALAGTIGNSVTAIPWAERRTALAEANLLVNTTTLGMVGKPALDLDLAALPTTAVVTDIVYTPLETPLLAAARSRGNRSIDGLGMLLHQARPGFHQWFGREAEVDAEVRAFVLAGLNG